MGVRGVIAGAGAFFGRANKVQPLRGRATFVYPVVVASDDSTPACGSKVRSCGAGFIHRPEGRCFCQPRLSEAGGWQGEIRSFPSLKGETMRTRLSSIHIDGSGMGHNTRSVVREVLWFPPKRSLDGAPSSWGNERQNGLGWATRRLGKFKCIWGGDFSVSNEWVEGKLCAMTWHKLAGQKAENKK